MVPHTNERTSRNIMPDVSTSEDSNKILKQASEALDHEEVQPFLQRLKELKERYNAMKKPEAL
ncbi:unnamed protein product [Cladocopium goreaui]|uniref:Uncharacterized protein n=1 Tax=Cladocopium goreaui TaxID=2562237 RepID=A0A9P1BQ68_9DINO|nr:unnamed protein product [Cladocopium goreaui]